MNAFVKTSSNSSLGHGRILSCYHNYRTTATTPKNSIWSGFEDVHSITTKNMYSTGGT